MIEFDDTIEQVNIFYNIRVRHLRNKQCKH
jgi:hypothetical protein